MPTPWGQPETGCTNSGGRVRGRGRAGLHGTPLCRCRAAARHDAAVRQGRRRSRGSDGGLTGHGCARSAEIVGRIVLRGHPLHAANACVKLLNHMVQYMTTRLDTSFAALSDATRRGILEQLGRADASITDLAEKFHMTLTGMKKHVGVLEQARLVTTHKIGREPKWQLGPRRFVEEEAGLPTDPRAWGGNLHAGGKG